MPKFEDFGDWIRERFGDQGGLADKLKPKVAKNTVSSWKTGRNRIPPDYEKQIRAMGYDGPLPETGVEISRADLESLREEVRNQAAWVREALRRENTALAAAIHEVLKRLEELQEKISG